jgi:hypothetical protein
MVATKSPSEKINDLVATGFANEKKDLMATTWSPSEKKNQKMT